MLIADNRPVRAFAPGPGEALPTNAPRNDQGRPFREAGDDCCPHYRFRQETGDNYHRCGWCRDFGGSENNTVCLNENNRRKTT